MNRKSQHSPRGFLARLTRRRGQFSVEYAVVIMVIIVALVGMAVYLRRAVSSRMRDAGDTFGHGRQYQP